MPAPGFPVTTITGSCWFSCARKAGLGSQHQRSLGVSCSGVEEGLPTEKFSARRSAQLLDRPGRQNVKGALQIADAYIQASTLERKIAEKVAAWLIPQPTLEHRQHAASCAEPTRADECLCAEELREADRELEATRLRDARQRLYVLQALCVTRGDDQRVAVSAQERRVRNRIDAFFR